ncbi:hypothetical protein MJ1_0547 [Nanobdella aerobiophila]|uniref:Uncharacterized protein n=1 Tax=Nanobdella aerobiophila TaxID=2586965 RepID=A0A915WRW9_9ARCH|nr:archaellin/type IV pilin N-terminal domain-containing protein [Nanobdella aerobiophila]BBL45699.1 hypothetical protein MJ1_0547 [Nanobdella aerobiophila]
MRSISPIIATILIIVITVAIAGLTYAFLSGLFSGLTSSTSNQVSRQSQYISFSITNSYCSNNILYIDIYNNGNVPIVINNNTVLTINNGNNNIVSINGNNIICNNNNTILQGSTDTCYINNSLCIYNPSNNNNPQITLDYQGVGNNNNLGNGYLVGYFTNPLPITIYNTQNISTPTPFQQDIAICNSSFSYSTSFSYVDNITLYNEINSNGSNILFYSNNGLLYSWYEGQENISTASCDVWWVNIPQGIPANSNITIYMGIGSTSTNYYQQDYPYVGASYNVLGTFQYDNIGDVMDPGLTYQIYYDNNNWYAPPESEVYQAELYNGYSFSGSGQTWASSTNPFTTPNTGTTQNVNGNNESYVINNLQDGYSGGSAFPNPPVSNGGNSYVIKEIGFVQVQQLTTFYVDIDDGGVLGINQSTCGITNWLCSPTGNNSANLINEWIGEGATIYSSPTVNSGDYAIEYDYFNGEGSAYWSLWSNNLVYYYSPALPPNGVMPSIYIS